MKRIAVLCSGFGSNLEAIIRAKKRGAIKAHIAVVIVDNDKACAIQRARRAKIPVAVITREHGLSREYFEHRIQQILARYKVDYVVLAGFMRVLSASFVRHYRNKMLNIHPALLPSFKGTHGIGDAYAYGAKVTGVTVHFVDEHVDHGPIIMQNAVPIKDTDTEKTLEARIHKVEHVLYPRCIALLVQGRLKVRGRRVFVR